jgi:hypothetical protein
MSVSRGGGAVEVFIDCIFGICVFEESHFVLFDRFVQWDDKCAIVASFFSVCLGVFSWEWLFDNNFFGRGRFPSIFGALDSPGQGGSDALSG